VTLIAVVDAQAAAERAAQTLAELLGDALDRRGVAHLALTGGTSAAPVYERLARRVSDWSQIHLWWGDERCVAPDDAAANFPIGQWTLIEPLGVRSDRVHRMRGELGPDEGARAYAAELGEHVEERDPAGMPVLDVVDLGLGPDGHVASLFPGHPLLDADDAPTAGVHDAPKPPPERITLTLPMLRAARRCVVHTAGSDRARAVAAALGDPDPRFPVSLLRRDRLTLVVDEDAASATG
jgi:6-phosphogluconolactonase